MLQSRTFVVGLARFIVVALGCTVLAPKQHASQAYQWPTLAEVLRQNSVPPPPGVDTTMTITSFGVLKNASEFAIAYYRYGGTDALEPPLYVLRYDESARRWHQHQFNDGDVRMSFTTGLQSRDQQPVMVGCLGSVNSISTVAGSLLVNTHLSPSAGCTMILRPNLKLVSAFSGWTVATSGSEIVVERSEIHFAATHPVRLALLDIATGGERDLFPPAHDDLRKRYQERLAATRDVGWCREHDAPCNPQQMSAELGKIAVSTHADAVAFEVTFEPDGFGPRAESQVGPEKCFYVFKLAPKLEYREFRESDMQRMFGAATPNTLVRDEVLRRIFTVY